MSNKVGTVIDLFPNKTAKILFDGEKVPSEKEYPYLEQYTPKIDDRVFLLDFANSYIIIGKINYQIEPPDPNFFDNLTVKNLSATKITNDEVQTATATATLAKTTADEAKKTAETASITANEAKTLAEETKTATEKACADIKAVADAAKTNATEAKTTANDAKNNSVTAVNTANNANNAANKASNTADAAQKAARDAQSTADSAKGSLNTLEQRLNRISNEVSTSNLRVSNGVGFFGRSPSGKRSVSRTSANDVVGLRNAINSLIDALQTYGLV